MRALPDRDILLRIIDVMCDRANHGLQILSSTGEEKSSFVAVGVEVDDGVLAQVVEVRLNPLRGAEQARFFAVPGTVDDGALGRPALLVQFAEHASFFELRSHSREGIVGAIHPGIVMVSANYPLIGSGRAAQGRDYIVHGFDIPVRHDFEMYARWAGTDMIGNGQCTAPVFRCDLTAQGR